MVLNKIYALTFKDVLQCPNNSNKMRRSEESLTVNLDSRSKCPPTSYGEEDIIFNIFFKLDQHRARPSSRLETVFFRNPIKNKALSPGM